MEDKDLSAADEIHFPEASLLVCPSQPHGWSLTVTSHGVVFCRVKAMTRATVSSLLLAVREDLQRQPPVLGLIPKAGRALSQPLESQ